MIGKAISTSTRGLCRSLSSAAAASPYAAIEGAPADPIFGLGLRFQADEFENKVLVGAGAYRTDEGKPWVLPSVRAAEQKMLGMELDHEYATIAGVPAFVSEALKFAYGADCAALAEGRVAAIQTLSGTGSLRVGGDFFTKFFGAGHPVYVPTPTWGNHHGIFKTAGCTVVPYRYYEPDTCGLDFGGMADDLRAAPEGAVVLLHSCAHNPTGVDPSEEQWKELSTIVKEKKLIPFFDNAYQGFASGDAVKDAFSLRYFVEEGHNILLSQSFSKNFGLYGQRTGTLSVVCKDKEEADRLNSQLKVFARTMYSNPPIHGARIVHTILTDPELEAQWYKECQSMADRIGGMRTALQDALASAGSTRDWSHITKQIGMFCFSGLTPEQVDAIIDEHHVYMTRDGRVSMAGVTSGNVEYIAHAMHAVTA